MGTCGAENYGWTKFGERLHFDTLLVTQTLSESIKFPILHGCKISEAKRKLWFYYVVVIIITKPHVQWVKQACAVSM